MISRLKLTLLAIVIWLLAPLVNTLMVGQSLFGSESRAHNMELAFDCCGNALFGGDPAVSISERTGNGVILGYAWAIRLAPVIDFFFGAGHCAANATIGAASTGGK
jgi:hypothetical protein